MGSKALITFTLRNGNDYAVKDVQISCAFNRRDGSHLTDRARVIHDTAFVQGYAKSPVIKWLTDPFSAFGYLSPYGLDALLQMGSACLWRRAGPSLPFKDRSLDLSLVLGAIVADVVRPGHRVERIHSGRYLQTGYLERNRREEDRRRHHVRPVGDPARARFPRTQPEAISVRPVDLAHVPARQDQRGLQRIGVAQPGNDEDQPRGARSLISGK